MLRLYISRFIFFLLFVCVFVFVAFFFSFLDLSFSLKRAHQLLWAAVWFVWSKITMQLLLFDARNTDISKIMWSEVKKNSRNKFLTINKNNEVHLFDLNSFYIYFCILLLSFPSFSLFSVAGVAWFFCFPVFVCTKFTELLHFIFHSLHLLYCNSRRFFVCVQWKHFAQTHAPAGYWLRPNNNGQNLADIDAI